MKHYSRWFGLGPYDENEGYEYHWYNRHREWGGPRYRLIVGDVHAMSTEEDGGIIGPTFEVSLEFAQEGMGCLDDYEMGTGRLIAEHDVHFLSIVFWRWGISLSVRGRKSEQR